MRAEDHELLQAYVREGSQPAFAELVQRYVNLVFSSARRQVRSHDLAQEVTQLVFITLARKARSVAPGTPIAAWLYVATRRIAIDLLRSEARRQAREQAAVELAAMKSDSPDWPRLEPWLDEAMSQLNPTDGSALLLRFFENKSLREVGAALGISEDAAQKRVTRALDQLRTAFGRKGIAVTAAGLATQLSAHAIEAAPAGFGATVSAATFATATTGGTAALATFKTLIMTTVQKHALVATLALAAGVVWYEGNSLRQQSAANARLLDDTSTRRAELARLRAERDAASARLATVEREIDARLAAATRTPESPADAALRQQMETWLAKLDRVDRFLASRPDLGIPELKFVPEDRWLSVVTASPLESEADMRKALASLRRAGEAATVQPIRRALAEYLKANDDRLPETPAQLDPFLPADFDRSILARYEMLVSGKAGELPRAMTRILGTTVVPDVEYDEAAWIGFTVRGPMTFTPQMLEQARTQFAAANGGRQATRPGELTPYLELPLPPQYARKKLRPTSTNPVR